MGYLTGNEIITPMRINVNYTNDDNEEHIENFADKVENILAGLDFSQLEKKDDTSYEVAQYVPVWSNFAESENELLTSCKEGIMATFKQIIGRLRQIKNLEVKRDDLKQKMTDAADPYPIDEIEDFINYAFDKVVSIEEWQSWFNWTAFGIAMLGVAIEVCGSSINQ